MFSIYANLPFDRALAAACLTCSIPSAFISLVEGSPIALISFLTLAVLHGYLLGLPAYWMLKRLDLLNVVSCTLAGLLIGTLPYALFFSPRISGPGVNHTETLVAMTLSGPLIGLLFWVFIRKNLESQRLTMLRQRGQHPVQKPNRPKMPVDPQEWEGIVRTEVNQAVRHKSRLTQMQKRPSLPAILQTSKLIHKDASVTLEDGVLRVSRSEMVLWIKRFKGDLFMASDLGSGPLIELQFSGEDLGYFEQSYGRDGHVDESHIRHLSLRGLYCKHGLEISIRADTAPTQAYGYNRKSAGIVINNGINIFCQFSVPASKLSSFFEGQDFPSDRRTTGSNSRCC